MVQNFSKGEESGAADFGREKQNEKGKHRMIWRFL